MRITVERDGFDDIVFEDVTDAFVAVRYPELHSNGETAICVMETRSYSWCGDSTREILKEVRQAGVELQRRLFELEVEEHSDDDTSRI